MVSQAILVNLDIQGILAKHIRANQVTLDIPARPQNPHKSNLHKINHHSSSRQATNLRRLQYLQLLWYNFNKVLLKNVFLFKIIIFENANFVKIWF